jgi:hypothetical protein
MDRDRGSPEAAWDDGLHGSVLLPDGVLGSCK